MTGDESNLFEAPAAPIAPRAGETSTEAEEIRWTYLKAEGSVKTVAGYGFILGGFWLLGMAANLFQALGILPTDRNGPAGGGMGPFETYALAASAAFGLVLSLCTLAISVGLRKLQTWARWCSAAVLGLAVLLGTLSFVVVLITAANATPIVALIFALPAIILAYSLRTLLSVDATAMFSPEYRQIVRATPAIRSHSSIVVKIAYGLFGVLVVLFLIGVVALWKQPAGQL